MTVTDARLTLDEAIDDEAYDLTCRRVANTLIILDAFCAGAVEWHEGVIVAARLQSMAAVVDPDFPDRSSICTRA